jgi:hypothetical protein
MPPKEWNRMMDEWDRTWAEHREVQDRIRQAFSSNGIPEERDLQRGDVLIEKLEALKNQQREYLERAFGPQK